MHAQILVKLSVLVVLLKEFFDFYNGKWHKIAQTKG